MEIDKKDNTLYKSYIIRDGEKLIILIPELSGFFGREGFTFISQEIITSMMKQQTHQEVNLPFSKIESLINRSVVRSKIVNEFYNNIRNDDGNTTGNSSDNNCIEF